MNEFIWSIEDLQDTWDDHIESINIVIDKKAQELGITEDKYHEMEFDLFDIQDMYKTETGLCFFCKQGKECKKHGLIKKKVIQGDENFKRYNLDQ